VVCEQTNARAEPDLDRLTSLQQVGSPAILKVCGHAAPIQNVPMAIRPTKWIVLASALKHFDIRGNPIGIGYFRGDAIYEWNIPLGSRSDRIAWSR
jgi:hypothetical protein